MSTAVRPLVEKRMKQLADALREYQDETLRLNESLDLCRERVNAIGKEVIELRAWLDANPEDDRL